MWSSAGGNRNLIDEENSGLHRRRTHVFRKVREVGFLLHLSSPALSPDTLQAALAPRAAAPGGIHVRGLHGRQLPCCSERGIPAQLLAARCFPGNTSETAGLLTDPLSTQH